MVYQTFCCLKKFVSFQVLEGMDVVRKIESAKTKSGDKPEQAVMISAAGHISVASVFSVDRGDAV